MKINILIPSKNNNKKLLENIKKNKFIKSINLQYLILVDSPEEETCYKESFSGFENVTIIKKNIKFQSDRYIYLLNYLNADLYLIGSDDVFFESADQIKCDLTLPLVLNCLNEQKQVVNHPLITNKFKYKVIKIFNDYKFIILCIDTLISFCASKEERVTINMKSSHNNYKKNITRLTYSSYIRDLSMFLKFLFSKFFTYGSFIRNTNFLFDVIIHILSATKNLIFKNKF